MNIWTEKNHETLQLFYTDIALTAAAMAPALAKDALLKGKSIFETSHNGHTKKEVQYYLDFLKNMGGKLFSKYVDPDPDNYECQIYIWDDSLAEISHSGSYVTIKVYSQNQEFVQKVGAFFSTTTFIPPKQGHIFAIVQSNGKLKLTSIGQPGMKLNKLNYMSSVIEDYQYVVHELNTASPAGRIVILEGEPGTGKTHLVKALLTDVDEGMFILVPPNMAAALSGPDLLPLLMETKNQHAIGGSIILVLEDADKCLVTRQDGDMSTISSILNLGDGILGSLLDIRIVATTNAKKFEIDPAVLRPGRLSKRIAVGPLSGDNAYLLFNTLTENLDHFELKLNNKIPDYKNKSEHTLAQVYLDARQAGWVPAERELENEIDEDL